MPTKPDDFLRRFSRFRIRIGRVPLGHDHDGSGGVGHGEGLYKLGPNLRWKIMRRGPVLKVCRCWALLYLVELNYLEKMEWMF